MKKTKHVVAITALGLLGVRCGSTTAGPEGNVQEISSALTTSLWASPAGTGTACSQTSPCSIVQAQANVRTLNAHMTGNIVVNLLDGVYPLGSTLSFGASDSGTGGFSVIWQAAPHATPVLSGGTPITGWTATPSKPGAFQASVAAGFNTRQLYVNGTRVPRAGGRMPVTLTATSTGYTYPNSSTWAMAGWKNQTGIEFEFNGEDTNNDHHWTDSRCPVASISSSPTTNITTITMAMPCWGNLMEPRCLGADPSCIPWFVTAGGAPTRVENALELLDEPGEWYLDAGAATLYYMPLSGQDMTSATVIAPRLETLLSASGTLNAPVHHLQFTGLTFAYATWLRPGNTAGFSEMQANFTQTDSAADGRQGGCMATTPTASCPFASWTKTPANVTFHAGQNIVLTGDTFTHLGGAGLGFEFGSSTDTVTGCTFTDISGTGIQLGGTDDPVPTDSRATVSHVTVSGNYIHDLPVEYLGGVGIFVGYTTAVAIQNNYISNTAYSGMSIGWGGWQLTPTNMNPPGLANASRNNVVANNHIFNVMQSLSDGGPLYSNGTRGTQFSDGDRYTGNHFHDSWHSSGHGVYDDIGSRWITIDKQVVYGVQSSWGGCAASGNLTFSNGFMAPQDQDFFACLPPAHPVSQTANAALAAADPAVDCETNAAYGASCAAIVASAGPQGGAAALVDGRGETPLVDDFDPAIVYTVGLWTPAPTRAPYQDAKDTLHYTSSPGASFSYPFTGTGIDYIAELDSNRGKVAISVDGVLYATVDCHAQELITSQVVARVRGLSPGSHSLQGVMVDGAFMSLDALRVYTTGPEGRPRDDTESVFSYAGAGWTSVTRSGLGEYQSTLHYTTANGDSYTLSFQGTGADLVGDRDSLRGPVDISVDGAFVQRIDASSVALSTQQLLFSVQGLTEGSHTIVATKRGGTYMDVDRANIHDSVTHNDDDAAVSYGPPPASSWVASKGRPYGDFNADVHYTTQDGDYAQFDFNGTGVDFISETNSDRGVVDVLVDGIPRPRIFSYSPSLGVQQTLYRLHGLALGNHRIVLTKRGGSFMAVDAFTVIQ